MNNVVEFSEINVKKIKKLNEIEITPFPTPLVV